MTADDMTLSLSVQPDQVIVGRFYRDPTDASDGFAYDASLIQIGLHYEKGQPGTVERNEPFTKF